MASQPDEGTGVSALYSALTRKWDAKTIDSFALALENHDAKETDRTTAAFQTIANKATGLLTHVSMMIAGLAICAPLVAQHRLEETIIIFEIAVYLLIAVGCLRCLSLFRVREFAGDSDFTAAIVEHELIIRRALYRFCMRASIFLTVLVFLLLPILFFWKPGIEVMNVTLAWLKDHLETDEPLD